MRLSWKMHQTPPECPLAETVPCACLAVCTPHQVALKSMHIAACAEPISCNQIIPRSPTGAGRYVPRAVLMDLEPGTMDSLRSGPFGQISNTRCCCLKLCDIWGHALPATLTTSCKLTGTEHERDQGVACLGPQGRATERRGAVLAVNGPHTEG